MLNPFKSNASCDIPGGSLKIKPSELPGPLHDIQAEGEAELVLGGGCFWCVEAVFREVDGVLDVTSGYAGGTANTADYHSVCSGTTDHAEVIKIRFDQARTSFGILLKLFFSVAHDPTQLNRQGNDSGRQYRSAIFYGDAEQREVGAAYIQQLNKAGVYKQSIVTTLEPLTQFFEAETYHQNYAALNPAQPYIQGVSMPKVEKLRAAYPERLRR